MSTHLSTQNKHHSQQKKSQALINWLARALTNKESFSAYIESVIQLFKPEWRHQHISAKVISTKIENRNIYTLTLKPNNKWTTFVAGQFVLLSAEINGRLLTRTFSISSAPRDFQETGFIELTIRAQDKGSVTPWLKDKLHAGSHVYLSPAMGDFVLSADHHQKVFIAAGSGITPIRAMLNEHKDAAWLKDAHLFFYLRSPEDAFFNSDLDQLAQKGLNIHRFYTEQSGHFSIAQLNDALVNTNINEIDYYICGPGKMIESCTSLLSSTGVSAAQIHSEYFGHAPIKMPGNLVDNSEFIQVDYLDSRKQVKFTSGTVTKTLLELAEEEGLKPVSGCRMGVCHQCICKKKQGRVFNTKTQEYSDSGAEDIQLCLSVPVGVVELEL